jgi:hypothetical protein
MSKKLLLAISLLFSLAAISQDKLWVRQTRVPEIIAFERSIASTSEFLDFDVAVSRDYYPLADKYQVTKPLIVHRPVLGFLPVYAQYFFTAGDSILRLVSYDWEKDRFGDFPTKKKIWAEEAKKLDAYDQEYSRILKGLISTLGKPVQSDGKPREQTATRGTHYVRDSVWETEEYYASLNMVFAEMTYRIRLMMYWKK